jgi:multicomponent Na+:H+ antiporter subunit C
MKEIEGILILLTILIGLYGTIMKRNLILKLLMLGIMNSSVIGFFLHSGIGESRTPPILSPSIQVFTQFDYADPLPQALVITAVVIGFATLALSLVYVMMIASKFHTVDEDQVEDTIEKDRLDELR